MGVFSQCVFSGHVIAPRQADIHLCSLVMPSWSLRLSKTACNTKSLLQGAEQLFYHLAKQKCRESILKVLKIEARFNNVCVYKLMQKGGPIDPNSFYVNKLKTYT